MTRQEDKSVLYAVYGTLRAGWGNNRILCKEDGSTRHGVEYLGIMKTDPLYTMYGKNAGFPVVAINGKTAITVEIYRVTDENIIKRVNGLEGYTGRRDDPQNWYNTTEVKTKWGIANMFCMEGRSGSRDNIIESGDWNEGKHYSNEFTKSLETA